MKGKKTGRNIMALLLAGLLVMTGIVWPEAEQVYAGVSDDYVAVLYVHNENDGKWEHVTDTNLVYTSLQGAMDDAGVMAGEQNGQVQVRVAAGIYPAGSNPFSLRSGVTVTGGFEGSEEEGVAPLGGPEETRIDGQNTRQVFFNRDVDESAVLQNVTIQNGKSMNGAGMHNVDSSPTLINCIFRNNQAGADGGGMYNKTATAGNENSKPTLVNCIFRNNQAERNGGGMYNDESSPVITGCTFSENRAYYDVGDPNTGGQGGGMYNQNSRPMIQNSSFYRNEAFTGGSGGAQGGAMFNKGGSLVVKNTIFEENFTRTNNPSGPMDKHSGGGMYNDHSNIRLEGCTFRENTSIGSTLGGYGGGMYSVGGLTVLTGCYFTGNQSHQEGGGLYATASASAHLILTSCVFDGNKANGGAGIFTNANVTVCAVACVFQNNSAFQSGGIHTTEKIMIMNSLFLNNQADILGNDLRVALDAKAFIVGSSFVDANPTANSSIYFDVNSSSVISHSILTQNAGADDTAVVDMRYVIQGNKYYDSDGNQKTGEFNHGLDLATGKIQNPASDAIQVGGTADYSAAWENDVIGGSFLELLEMAGLDQGMAQTGFDVSKIYDLDGYAKSRGASMDIGAYTWPDGTPVTPAVTLESKGWAENGSEILNPGQVVTGDALVTGVYTLEELPLGMVFDLTKYSLTYEVGSQGEKPVENGEKISIPKAERAPGETVEVTFRLYRNDGTPTLIETQTLAYKYKAPVKTYDFVVENKVYDGTREAAVSEVHVQLVHGGGTMVFKNGTDITAAAAFDQPDAGDWNVTGTVVLNETAAAQYVLANGMLMDGSASITKASGLEARDIYVYLPVEETTPKAIHFDLSEIPLNRSDPGQVYYQLGASDTTSVFESAVSLIAGRYSALLRENLSQGEQGTQEIIIEPQNYNGDTAILTFVASNKRILDFSAEVPSIAYNGQPYPWDASMVKAEDNGIPVTDYGALHVTWSGVQRDGTPYSSTEPPVNAGTYQLKIEIPPDDLIYIGEKIITFSILPRELTLSAEDKTVTQGSAMPSLTYTVAGLVSNETPGQALAEEPTLAAGTSNTSTPGTYNILVTGGKTTNNYIIANRVNGKLRVLTRDSGSSSGSSSPVVSEYVVRFNTNGGSDVGRMIIKKGGTLEQPKNPVREGYTFTGWYSDKELTRLFDFNTPVSKSIVLYAGWALIETGLQEQDMPQPELVKAYSSGYPDGTFRPDNAMTRAEAAMLLYNLAHSGELVPKDLASDHTGFADVPVGAWHYNAVTFLAETGAVSGYPDGTFQPDNPITRAEFTAIITRLTGMTGGGEAGFSDVPANHWASGMINNAANEGLVSGYSAAAFGPDDAMTRAQAVTVINNMLNRNISPALFTGMKSPFSDVDLSHWAFYHIMAAAVEHQKQ